MLKDKLKMFVPVLVGFVAYITNNFIGFELTANLQNSIITILTMILVYAVPNK